MLEQAKESADAGLKLREETIFQTEREKEMNKNPFFSLFPLVKEYF